MSDLFPLTVSGAQTARRGKVLVGPIDLELGGSGTTVVMGPNGSGKTTLLRMLHGTARLTRGSIDWACGYHEARQQQGFVFQQPVMLRRSVLENIAYPLRIRGIGKAIAYEQAAEWGGRVGLTNLLERSATALSGGEKQKLALARAMITKPKVLFLDEPSAALDGRATREIEDILQDARQAGTRLILSTHDIGQAKRLADDILFLLHGLLHEQTAAAAFFDAPQTPQARSFLNGDIVE
ncbi:ATP-binding cassette domain-containing protein [Sulfitobacter donghicola]|uniref:Sulfate ABC transporter ATP-binding protein n=1 Tax=Sulfitobacter donghicola DSW-25 = KCTC 12864 = JCM 14565 TaxID=1300350 RepID=A0A073IGL3_9RHOB|nr:ATP-binding cassette domain-containing protein [Sulfitobacter donghicola]KEJ88631.1 sulfate ABC transporter ATP-binding protein [Sulfitobacter donghicola DSW-25 = KCTC 12864 = JCM 14565]KIN68397.1 Tungstate ABC transporter, ATP-binding protein TupC [Sulfitobacter donghicola DSW-25 = KCTC 12864 = JCM 14565]